MKKIIFGCLTVMLTMILVAFTSNGMEFDNKNTNSGRESLSKTKNSGGNSIKSESEIPNHEPYLTIGGNANPAEYTSNSKLDVAHTLIAAVTYKTTFNAGGEPLNLEILNDTLLDTRDELLEIKYKGEKELKLQKAIDLINKAIKSNTNLDDPILRDIHKIIHELLKYFNGEAKDIKVNKTGVPINKEDRIPGFDYSSR